MKITQIALAATMALVSGAALAQPVPPPAPPLIVEAPPPLPGPAAQWALEPGHYVWRPMHGGWVWVRAHWVFRTAGFTRWIPGHINRFGEWVPGHWVR
jgi:hypothetical protein